MKKIILCFALTLLAFPVWAELEVITLQHRSAEEVLPVILPLLDKDGKASGMNNQLILRTSPRNLTEIRRLLPGIDTVPRRLKITVMQNVDSETVKRLTEISGSVSMGHGMEFTVPDNADDGDFLLEAKQAEDRMRARVISTRSLEDDKKNQQIQVVEGGRALILIGQSLPVFPQPPRVRRWEAGNTQYLDANSGFYVRPRLNGDRVTLEISAQNDAIASDTSGDSFSAPSAIQTQRLITTVNGRLGAWIELGDATRQAEGDDSTLSTRSVSDVNERRSVLLKVEEMP